MLFSVVNFRMRPGEENLDGPPIHGNTRLEVIWTAIPAIMLVVLCSYAWIVLNDIEEAQANEMRVNVTGQQFAWTFEYPQAGGKPIKSTQLYLPKDRPVRFYVKALDVMHDFWVPAFRMKIDAVPGIETKYRVTPNRLGTYPVVCAELCGLGHSVMRETAHVVTPADFDKWLAEQKAPAAGRRRRRRRGRRQDALHRRQRHGDRLRLLPHARRRRHDRQDRPDLDKVAGRARTRRSSSSRSSSPTRRSRRASRRASCRRTTAIPSRRGARGPREVPRRGRREVSTTMRRSKR